MITRERSGTPGKGAKGETRGLVCLACLVYLVCLVSREKARKARLSPPDGWDGQHVKSTRVSCVRYTGKTQDGLSVYIPAIADMIHINGLVTLIDYKKDAKISNSQSVISFQVTGHRLDVKMMDGPSPQLSHFVPNALLLRIF